MGRFPAMTLFHCADVRALALVGWVACVSLPVQAAEPAGHGAAHPAPAAADKKPAAAAPVKAAAAAADRDNLEQLRQRLAEKLGAAPAPEAKSGHVLRVSNGATSGETVIAAAHVPATAPRASRPAARAPEPAARSAAPGHGPAVADAHGGELHWSYQGAGAPDAWGQLKPEFRLCQVGQRQSPIDIRGGIAVELEPIQFDYRATGFSVIDNGHTVQVNVPPGNAITVLGRRYDLLQFHFHRPSEERINGRQFDMVAHLVHKDPEGRLAVVAVLLERGGVQPVIQAVWNALPLEKGVEQPAPVAIDLQALLPTDRRYYTYMGSLTTPPCSEGVLWMVMKQPVPLSPDQLGIFARLYPMNARPVQQVSGRLIKESN